MSNFKWGTVEMERRDQYRHYARECLEQAKTTQNPQTKTVLVGMAQAWIRLADQAAAVCDLPMEAEDRRSA